mgnify:CR=1 FL=1
MMKEKGQFKKKFVKKIATIMMAAAMVVSGGFGVAPAADHSVSVYAADNAYRGYHVTLRRQKRNLRPHLQRKASCQKIMQTKQQKQ